ncbi:hypothetical protein JD276_14000 [Leucobacter sp. CSA1]|uniref:Uncharacterized protein n=1 Tax=Leucobacter chromiisoli TaxID=2796471 RepID=A0A934Q942_9MICO|nr:hypothetical protein [Leucobacter chromiisoli]MBK0420146.1 hypothetical protein [Leucobacter chromiisoli]
MEALPGIWSLTPIGALLGAVVTLYWLLGSGRLIPRSSHERELAQAVKRGDEWKETALDQRTVNAEIRRQNTMLLEAGRTGAKFFADVAPSIEDTEDHRVGP